MEHVVARLMERFPDSTSERVHLVVDEEHQRFEGRPVRDFVPVLVERAARQRLSGEWSAVPLPPTEPDASRPMDDPAEIDPMERERQKRQGETLLFGDLGGGPA